MALFKTGDNVSYSTTGRMLELRGFVGVIEGVKVAYSEETSRPIYYVRWKGDERPYEYGIHEHNLVPLREKPKWRV